MITLDKLIHEKLSVMSAARIAETPKGSLTAPAYVHDADGGDALPSTQGLEANRAKAARTLADYAQALYEIAATADILSHVWEIEAPEFARVAKSAKSAVKKLKGAAVAVQAIDSAKGSSRRD